MGADGEDNEEEEEDEPSLDSSHGQQHMFVDSNAITGPKVETNPNTERVIEDDKPYINSMAERMIASENSQPLKLSNDTGINNSGPSDNE
jgi:hypothetical protein